MTPRVTGSPIGEQAIVRPFEASLWMGLDFCRCRQVVVMPICSADSHSAETAEVACLRHFWSL
jgi:hypothetical protein